MRALGSAGLELGSQDESLNLILEGGDDFFVVLGLLEELGDLVSEVVDGCDERVEEIGGNPHGRLGSWLGHLGLGM